MQSSKINLSDGRCLGYAEYGNTRGQPLFFFHGQPRNRLFWHTDETLTASLNVRLIVVDSPGYRLSDFQPWRKLLDWPRDVSKFADALGIGQFAVLGFSAGGPYALACVHQIPEQLTLVGIADSAPPMYLPEINCSAHGSLRTNYLLAWDAPGVLRILFKVFWAYSRRNPDAFLKMAQVQSPRTDKDIMSLPGFHSMLSEGWKENLREDSGGYVQDIEILMKDLGFQLSGIQKEIYLWQGAGDVSTPAARARFMAGELLHCKTAFFSEDAHFAILSQWSVVFHQLTGID